MLSLLRDLIPDLQRLEEYPIDSDQKTVGYHSIIYCSDNTPFGGGCGETIEISRRIAVAECIERAHYLRLKSSPEAPSFLLQEFPTSCGFAAGFDREKTKFRAVFEAIERWHWSKWIDFGHALAPTGVKRDLLTDYSRYFHDCFDEHLFFQRDFTYSGMDLRIGVFLGLKDGGVFPGSRVAHRKDDLWSHALVEAWRHRMIFLHYERRKVDPETLFDRRIIHFGQNQDAALAQIHRATNPDWASPHLRLLKEHEIQGAPYFLWRALCEDFIGWHLGDERRFVY